MNKQKLYDEMAARKSAPKDFNTYIGDNGRVNRCAALINSGKLRSGGILLDVGGGIGDLGASCRDLYDKTITLDISEQNLIAANSKGNHVALSDTDVDGLNGRVHTPDMYINNINKEGSYEWLEDSTGKISLITALDFIEHIIDPEYFARECFEMLEPGGQLFINTPNIQYFPHLESQLRGVFPHTSGDKEVFHGGHLSFFNFFDMEQIFGKAGFINLEQIEDDEGYRDPPKFFIDFLTPKNQSEYVIACTRLGNPNLLFSCFKP